MSKLKAQFNRSQLRSWIEDGHRFSIHAFGSRKETKYALYLESSLGFRCWLLSKPPSLQSGLRVDTKEDGLYSEAFVGFEGPVSSNMDDGVFLLWDRGSCWVGSRKDKCSSIEALEEAFKLGNIEISFEGEKLKGRFHLSRNPQKSNAWKLSKQADRFATTSLFRFNAESVFSQRSIDDWLSSHSMAVGRSWADLALPKRVSLEKVKTTYEATCLSGRRKAFLESSLGSEIKASSYRLSDSVYPTLQMSRLDVLAYYHMVWPFLSQRISTHASHIYLYPQGFKDKLSVKNRKIIHLNKASATLLDTKRNFFKALAAGGLELVHSLDELSHSGYCSSLVIALQARSSENSGIIEMALKIRELFRSMGIQLRCKTTGVQAGLHLDIPLAASNHFKDLHQAGKQLLHSLVESYPSWLSAKPEKDKIWIYLPALGPGRYLVAPYSLRATAGANIACPIGWDELQAGLKPESIAIDEVCHRLEWYGDIWAKKVDPSLSWDLKSDWRKILSSSK